ncbi:MAG: BatA domain-containing protein [Chloroherpetonaceae bacterium]|nr:BatA domain-containing protein [Chloroherpetonaceae bacterium]
MGFLFPFFFWLSAFIATTITIHFLNQNEVKPRFVGSVKFLKDIPISKLRTFSLNQIPLLILRLLILSLLIFLLSNYYSLLQPDSTSARVALIHPSLRNRVIEQDNSNLIRTLDSLKKDGYELRQFQEGFPETNFEIFGTSKGQEIEPFAHTYWSLLEKASAQFPGRPLYLLLPNQLKLHGKAAEISNPIEIQPFEIRNDYSLLSAEPINTDTLRVFISNSKGEVLTHSLKIGDIENEYPQTFSKSHLSAFYIEGKKNEIGLAFASNESNQPARFSFPLDTLRAAIVFDKEYSKETALAQMLLEATFYGRLHRIERMNNVSFFSKNEKFQLVFWLSASLISDSLKGCIPAFLTVPTSSNEESIQLDTFRLLLGERNFVIRNVKPNSENTLQVPSIPLLIATDGTSLIEVKQNQFGSIHLRINFPLIENYFSFQPEFAERIGSFLRSYFTTPLHFKTSQLAASQTMMTAQSLLPKSIFSQERSNLVKEKQPLNDTLEKILWVILSLCIIFERFWCFSPFRFEFTNFVKRTPVSIEL